MTDPHNDNQPERDPDDNGLVPWNEELELHDRFEQVLGD